MMEQLTQEHGYDALDETAWEAITPSGGISINLNRGRAILLLLLFLLLEGSAYWALVNSPALPWYQVVTLVAGVVLFGLSMPLILSMLIWAHPLLRFDEDGITNIESRFFHWRRRQAHWEDIRGILVSRARNLHPILGRYELTLVVGRDRARLVKFKNWELPASARGSLRVATRVYQQQIADQDIWLHGIK
jgi:hypothetical protein